VSKSNWEKRKRSVCLLPVQTHVTESTVGYVKRKRMSFDLNQNCSKLLAHRPLADVLAYCSLPYCSLLVQRQIATRQIFIGYVMFVFNDIVQVVCVIDDTLSIVPHSVRRTTDAPLNGNCLCSRDGLREGLAQLPPPKEKMSPPKPIENFDLLPTSNLDCFLCQC
jgi:hypothetical protein